MAQWPLSITLLLFLIAIRTVGAVLETENDAGMPEALPRSADSDSASGDRIRKRNETDAFHLDSLEDFGRVDRIQRRQLLPNAVLGRDDRVRVRDTTAMPFSGIVHLEIVSRYGTSTW
jgi:V8-like Glu-specific endopeptidase